MPSSGLSPAWRRTSTLVLAALVAAASPLGAADGSVVAAATHGDDLREYARRLEAELERVVTERERALGDLEAERAAAKRALDRVLEQSVAREGALAEGLRRERVLEAKLAAAAADRERLLGEIAAEAEQRTRAEIEAALGRAAVLDRLRTAELDRDEAIRLGEEAHRAAAGLAGEAETLRARIRELEHDLALATADPSPPPAASRRTEELEAARTEASSLRAELAAARRRLRALESARDGLEKALADARARRGAPPGGPPASGEEDAEELVRQLALERERRATLEAEMVRLSVSSDVAERYREAWDALQQARAEILLLSERLEQERATREELQVLLERARLAAEAHDDDEPLERLVEAAETHGRDTERLEADLRDANDRIARLRGHLETIEAPDGSGSTIAALEEENDRLRESLRTAEQRVGRLAGQAALARRLAEIVYAR